MEYIPVNSNSTYYIAVYIKENEYNIKITDIIVGLYDESKILLSRPRYNSTNRKFIKTNDINNTPVKYIRLALLKEGYGNIIPNIIEKIILVESSEEVDIYEYFVSKYQIENLPTIENEVTIIKNIVNNFTTVKYTNNILPLDTNNLNYIEYYGVTCKAISENKIAIYGTCTGLTKIYINPDGVLKEINESLVDVIGLDKYSLPTGSYNFKYSVHYPVTTSITMKALLSGYNASSDTSLNINTSNIQSDTYNIIISFHCNKNYNYGTEEDPTILTFNVREGFDDYELEEDYILRYDYQDTYAMNKIRDINSRLSVINDSTIILDALSDSNLKTNELNKAFIKNISINADRTLPSTIYNELLSACSAVINRHTNKSSNLVRFTYITDIHYGGSRSNSNDPTKNIEAFISLTNQLADFAVNGGDLITNYYNETYMNSINIAKQTQVQVNSLFRSLNKPYLICKGNHDIGINGFSKVSAPSEYSDGYFGINTSTGAIYRLTEENFNAYLNGGGDFYQLTGYTYFDNQEIQEICLNGYSSNYNFNSQDPYGWYYYYDIRDVRAIVLNDFYNTGTITSGGNSVSNEEELWFTSVLSDALNNNKHVITFSHSAAGLYRYASIINNFITNGGYYIGHIHGHEHCDIYIKSNGLNNIGHNYSIISPSILTRIEGYIFSMFEIDLEHKMLYEVRVGVYNDKGDDGHGEANYYRSEDRVFSYNQHNILIPSK